MVMKEIAVTAGRYGTVAVTGLTLLGTGMAHADDTIILESCREELQLSDSGCACVLDRVHSELSEEQLVFFVAAISGDQASMVSAQMQLTGAEMMEMATFMTETPQQCENQ